MEHGNLVSLITMGLLNFYFGHSITPSFKYNYSSTCTFLCFPYSVMRKLTCPELMLEASKVELQNNNPPTAIATSLKLM